MSFLGVPHLHLIILPLIPCPFSRDGVPHPDVSGPRSGQGVPQGTLHPGQNRVLWGSPSVLTTAKLYACGQRSPKLIGGGNLLYVKAQVRRGVLGYPPPPDRTSCGRYASCSFMQEECLVNQCFQ